MDTAEHDEVNEVDSTTDDWSRALVITKGAPGKPPIVTFCGVDVARMNAEIVLACRAEALALFVPLMRNGATETALATATQIIHEEVADSEGAEDLVVFLAGLAYYFLAPDRVRAVVAQAWGSEEMLDRAMRRYLNYRKGYQEAVRRGILLMLGGRFGNIPAVLEEAIMRADAGRLMNLIPHFVSETVEQLATLFGVQSA